MKTVIDFLKKNGFSKSQEETSYPVYTNYKCDVIFYNDHYSVINNDDGGIIHSINLNIYWLVGVLTWYEYIEKNYK